MSILFSPREYTYEEVSRWCWLRAIEWGRWPLFIAQPIAPILFIFFPWWKIVIAVVVLDWLWTLIRYKYISIILADLGCLIVYLKWPLSVGVGIYFLVMGNYLLSAFSVFWPIITLILQFITPPMQIGKIQELLLNKVEVMLGK